MAQNVTEYTRRLLYNIAQRVCMPLGKKQQMTRQQPIPVCQHNTEVHRRQAGLQPTGLHKTSHTHTWTAQRGDTHNHAAVKGTTPCLSKHRAGIAKDGATLAADGEVCVQGRAKPATQQHRQPKPASIQPPAASIHAKIVCTTDEQRVCASKTGASHHTHMRPPAHQAAVNLHHTPFRAATTVHTCTPW